MEAPAQRLEVLLTQPVSVARSWSSVIAGAVALDRKHELARTDWMPSNEIDAVFRRSPLRHDRYSSVRKRLRDVRLEPVGCHIRWSSIAERAPIAPRVLEIL